MPFQDDPNVIRWRLHLISPLERVYAALATDEGRASFWAESAVEQEGVIHFVFPNGATWQGRVLEAAQPYIFAVEHYGGSVAQFTLADDGGGGTELTLSDTGVPDAYRAEVTAGWVSVLLALKAAVDYGVDLRNHDPKRSWEQGYVKN